MPTELSQIKTKARLELRKFANKRIKLKRDVFFVPGWTDEGCMCWTEPYTEGGIDRRQGWEYTVKDWEYIIENPEKMHYLKLVDNEDTIQIIRNKKGKVQKVEFKTDSTENYANFFQFAELIKRKIQSTGAREFDLIGHSMGGLDIISAAVLDAEQDNYPEVKEFITTKPLSGIGLLITVSTPYKGSDPATLAKRTKLDEIFCKSWSPGVRQQCNNMAFDSKFIEIINKSDIRKRLLNRVSIGVHTFGSRNDRAVAYEYTQIEGATNHSEIVLAQHSQRMGITQDPRVHLELFNLLSTS